MPANLTPQYLEAEAQYKKAQTAEERWAALREMWKELPKHKGTDKMQAELKAKLSEAKNEVEHEKKHPKKGGVSYKIPRQGAGQYVIVGGPNVGKSSVLAKLTRAHAHVAPFPFTTHEPQAGMMDWEDVHVQLVDLPPVTADHMDGYVSSLVRAADAAILMLDLADDDGPFAAEAVIERLAQTKTLLVGQLPAASEEQGVQHVRTLIAANKIDAPGAQDRLEIVREMFEARFPMHVISLEHGTGIEDFRTDLFKSLHVIRVYTKQPGKPPDLTAPFTLPANGTIVELAGLVHRDFADKVKTARLWGTGVFDGQTVGRDHVLHDKDVVELHM